MRRQSFQRIVIFITAVLFILPASFSEGSNLYSAEALEQFCRQWNDYYSLNNAKIYGSYTLSKDRQTVGSIYAVCEPGGPERPFSVFPDDTYLQFLCISYDVFNFCICSDKMKEDLEDVAIETAAGVQEDIVFWNSHTANDTWTIVLNEQEVSELYETDRFTIRFTAGGRSKSVEVSKEKNGYVFEMLSFLFRARRYSDPTAREYLSPDCLP